ncbi:MAG: VTT domain-containing protein [Anaerolineales bacterium]|jgi:membrane protein DedA with SNARE-associated domain|uniref:DedA family protein n=1 Tax=Candidatus Villigracilis vicinus TaxID=3140679 RepID=UPI003136673E|nr:VTT domain-containing protein [Anaerolineales bacterium]MBK9778801.1 VTT domain-containing protein [Anaerolineales bacterium]
MSDTISGFFLTQVINYGAPLFALTLFLGAVGLPVGASLMVIAVGAFSQQGYFDWKGMAILGLLGAGLGDMLSYGMGHYSKDWVERRFGESPTWINARGNFDKRAWAAVFLTRFLVTALAIPTNLIAGGSGYKFKHFMLYDILGEITWIILYGGLGYMFGTQWELVYEFIGNFGGFVLGTVIIGAGIWLARRQSGRTHATEQAIQN